MRVRKLGLYIYIYRYFGNFTFNRVESRSGCGPLRSSRAEYLQVR